MKFVHHISVLLALVFQCTLTDASNFEFDIDGGFFGGAVVGDTSASFSPPKTKTITKKFAAYGSLPSSASCWDGDAYCDWAGAYGGGTKDSPIAVIGCLAAEESTALSKVWVGIRARLRVKQDPFNEVKRIALRARSNTGALAVAFAQAGSVAISASYVDVQADAKSRKKFWKILASKAKASAGATAGAVGIAKAGATSDGVSTSEGATGVNVFVTGRRIRRFRGHIYSYLASFASAAADSATATVSITDAAAAAYTKTFARIWKKTRDDDYDAEVVTAYAAEYASSFAAAIGKIKFRSYIYAAVTDRPGRSARIKLLGGVDGGAVVASVCAA